MPIELSKHASGDDPPARLVIAFVATPQSALTDAVVLSDEQVVGARWEPLSSTLGTDVLDHARASLKRLNALCDENGHRHASAVRHGGHEPWWFHQQTAFDEYLVPFEHYRPLLSRCLQAKRAVIWGCPPDLRRILHLVPGTGHVELRGAIEPAPSLVRTRRFASAVFYRIATALAIGRVLLRRRRYLVYSMDAVDAQGRSSWLHGLHRAIADRGATFVELLWSDGGRSALKQWFARGRSVLFSQAVAPLGGPETAARSNRDDPTQLTEGFLTNLARLVLMPRARHSVRMMRRYDHLLRLLRPRGVFLMDDPVHAFELAAACRSRGVPTVAVQHGQFSRYTVGLMTRDEGVGTFDRYCVWGDLFRDILIQHSRVVAPDSIVVAGSPRGYEGASEAARDGTPLSPTQPTPRVLFVVEHHDPVTLRREVSAYFAALVDAGLDVWIKPHPGLPPASTTEDAAVARARVVGGPIEALIDSVNVIVASSSSVIFEAIRRERAVVLFGTSKVRDPHGLAHSGMADLASSPDQIAALARAAASLPAAELERRRARVWGPGADRDGGAVAVAVMERLAG